MKAQMKMLIASIAVVALAMTTVSGLTYSWFSDEEKAQIDIEMGNVSIDVSYGSAIIYASNGDGGFSTITDGSRTAEINTSGTSVSVKLKNFIPGDKVDLPFTITNHSTIDCKYRYSVTTDKNIDLDVKVTCGDRTIIDRLESQWDDTIVKPTDPSVTGKFTLQIPEDYAYQSKKTSYEFTISAYQYNASVSAPYDGTYNIVGMKRAVDNYYDGAASYIEVWSAKGLVDVINDYNNILNDLAENVGGHKDCTYLDKWQVRLLKDLDFENKEMKSLPFPYGSLDGQGHTIKNVNIVDNDVDNSDVSVGEDGKKSVSKCVGLFKTAKPISDLNVDNIHIQSSVKKGQDSGIGDLKVLQVYIGTIAGYTTASWTNVHVSDFSVKSIEPSTGNTEAYVGGLVGNCYGPKENCSVSNGSISGGKNVGGFAGFIAVDEGNSLEIKDCSVSKVTIKDTETIMEGGVERTSIGQFVGRINNTGNGITLSDCTVTEVTEDRFNRIYGDIPNGSATINGVVYPKTSAST